MVSMRKTKENKIQIVNTSFWLKRDNSWASGLNCRMVGELENVERITDLGVLRLHSRCM